MDMHDSIISKLTNIEVTRACGLHPWEKHPERPNRLLISIEMHATVKPGRLDAAPFLDYDVVRSYLETFPSLPHTDLLETIADDICTVCFSISAVNACRVEIKKPDIFPNAEAAGISVYRTRQGFEPLT